MTPVFRFAPSPNGELHLGHALSALLNSDMAEASGGRLLLRMEDIDPARCRPEYEAAIDEDLRWLGFAWEEPVRRQSEHAADYRMALEILRGRNLVYPAFLSRAEVKARVVAFEAEGGSWPRDPDGTPLYPIEERGLDPDIATRRIAAGERHMWRMDMAKALSDPSLLRPPPSVLPDISPAGGEIGERLTPCLKLASNDECEAKDGRGTAPHPISPLEGEMSGRAEGDIAPAEQKDFGPATQIKSLPSLAWTETSSGFPETIAADPSIWGDVVLWRWDAPSSYHLSVVLDDALQGITHVVRGRDLYHATPMHRLLQTLFGLPAPVYHHHALLLDESGEKLSKSVGSTGLRALRQSGLTPLDIRRRIGLDRRPA